MKNSQLNIAGGKQEAGCNLKNWFFEVDLQQQIGGTKLILLIPFRIAKIDLVDT